MISDRLDYIEGLPDGFFDLSVENILTVFPNPTLLSLPGNKHDAVFVSILLHGNEYSGLLAAQRLLRQYPKGLPRSMYLFIGNVQAAAVGQRTLPGQTDFNRCWPGTELPPDPVIGLAQQVFERVTAGELFAAIDVHNNSGANPHYACMTDVTQANQHLAAMFNHIGLVFKRPRGVSTMAFDGVCPAVTIECGRPGDEAGVEHATEMLNALLNIDHLPQRPVAAHDLQLVQSLATLNIPDDVSFDFNLLAQADLTFDAGFERKNFTELKATDVFAHTRIARPLRITNQDGEDITDEIMRVENGKVYLNRPLMPAMITLNKAIVRQDCLCYLLADYHA
jgi:succinylglutamate desuccinylase